jgi:putative SbcD/Mre11-related phosphoesterase
MIRLFDEWLLLPQRIALHERSATAVLADVHLGYSAARQRLGDAVPWRTVEEEMQPLTSAAIGHDIRQLIVAGDLFERGFDATICRHFIEVLHRLGIALLGVIPGNHDRGLEAASIVLPLFSDGLDLHGWQINHGDQPVESPQAIMGHWHPAIRWKRRKLPAFMVRGRHLVLPAFSRDAAGADVHADRHWFGWTGYAVLGDDLIEIDELRPARQQKTHDKRRGS